MIINHFPHIRVDPLNTDWTPGVHVEPQQSNIHHDLVARFPRLVKILAEVHNPMNNLYWETWPPSLETTKWGWTRFDLWSLKAQKAFNELWPADGDDWIDYLIDIYGSNWHNALPILSVRDQAFFIDNLRSEIKSQAGFMAEKYKDKSDLDVDLILRYAPWVRTVKRRKWVYPNPKHCIICGIGYYADTVRHYLVRQWGHNNACPRCLFIASTGVPVNSPLYRNFSRVEVQKYLQELAALIQFIPSQAFRETVSNPGFDPDVSVRVLAAMICLPTAQMIRKKFGGISWLEILQKADLVGDAWRSARGTFCKASDGHLCRSLAERSIDDWFTKHGINHESEPYWPHDDEFNPNGKFRADWKLFDGTFVEYAGLNTEEYLFKIERKRQLALRNGLKLIVLFPEDLQRLNEVFKIWLN